MRYITLAYIEFMCELIDCDGLFYIVLDVGYQFAVEAWRCIRFGRMILLIYISVDTEEKVRNLNVYLRSLAVAVKLCFLNDIEELGLKRIEGYKVGMMYISLLEFRKIKDIAEVGRHGVEVFVISFAYPEDYSLIRLFGIV